MKADPQIADPVGVRPEEQPAARRGLASLLLRAFEAGGESREKLEAARRMSLVQALLVLALVVILSYGTHYLQRGMLLIGSLEYALAALFAAILIHLRVTKKLCLATHLGTTAFGLLILSLVALASPSQSLWGFTFPLVALFLLGPKRGTVAIVFFLAATFLLFVVDPGPPFAVFPTELKIRYLVVCVVVSIIAYFYETIRIRYQAITERKNEELERALTSLEAASDALREGQSKYRELVDRANDGIVIVKDGIIRFANPRLAEFTGVPVAQIEGNNFVRFVHPDCRRRMIDHYAARIAGRSVPAVYESVLLVGSGRTVDVEVNSGLISYDGGSAFLALIRDVGDRKRAEEEKAQLEEKLNHGQKMEAIGELAGGVAHDFNNMLSAISGLSELMLRKLGPEDRQLKEYAGTILNTSMRASEFTAKLLAFARKGALTMAPTSVHRTLEDVIVLLTRTIDRRIEIRRRLDANLDTVNGDAAQLQNAVLNLAVNARDAMPEGGRLTFSTRVVAIGSAARSDELAPGRYLELVVSDTGVGMPREVRERVFEPFFTTKETGKGTGLGLASVYGTVRSHGGAIEVASEPGMGTTFTLLLPVIEIAVDEPGGAAAQVGNLSGRVLVIDDEPCVREMSKAMLEEIGFTVDLAVDGLDGVNHLRAHPEEIDLVLVDIVMPRMGGAECIRELRRIRPDLPSIVTSGYSMGDDAERSMEAGARVFLPKPYTLEELCDSVSTALAAEGPSRSAVGNGCRDGAAIR